MNDEKPRDAMDTEPELEDSQTENSASQQGSSSIDTNEIVTVSNRIDECLPEANIRLLDLLNRSLDGNWLKQPAQLARFKELVSNAKFCGDWWQIKRDNQKELARAIEQFTGTPIILNSLIDIQVGAIEQNQRQMLNLLHIITLYARLKINAHEDTIKRFTHRSVPRTFIFAGKLNSDQSIDELMSRLIERVGIVINSDPTVQDRLRVIHLNSERGLSVLHAAADLSEQLSHDNAEDFDLNLFNFALNGAATIATRTKTNLELQRRTRANNVFLFGMTAQAAQQLKTDYKPQEFYAANAELRQAINLIESGYFSDKDDSTFKPLVDRLLFDDPDLVLADYSSYMDCQEEISQIYQDQKAWTRRSILTAAEMTSFYVEHSTLQPQAR